MPPGERFVCGDVLVESESRVGPQVHGRARGPGAVSHGCHQAQAWEPEHLRRTMVRGQEVERGNVDAGLNLAALKLF